MRGSIRIALTGLLVAGLFLTVCGGCSKKRSSKAVPFGIATAVLPAGTESIPYSTQLAGQAGTLPYSWTLFSGALPVGLTLDPVAGTISGTPAWGEAAGSPFSFQVQLADSASNVANRDFTLVVNPGPLEIGSPSLKVAAELLPYSFQVLGRGGTPPYTWEIAQGPLPSGLTLEMATGIISGTPASGESGSSPFAVRLRLTDADSTVVTRNYDLVVDPPGGFGGGTPTGTINVVVLAKETLLPLPGAFVMIGPGPDIPFVGNYALTDANGLAQFTDPALDNPATPPMVTAGADLRQYLSIVGADASGFVLPIDLIVDPGTKSRLTGMITGQNVTPLVNLHAAILIPPVRLSELFNIRLENLFLGEECVCATCDKMLLPGNLSYPTQDLFVLPGGDDFPSKSYFLDAETGSTMHLAATAGFIDANTLLQFVAGGNPNRFLLFTQLEIEGFGIVLDYPVTGAATVDVPITVGLGTPVDVTVVNSPRGADVFMAAAADLDASGGTGQIIASDFGFVPRDQTLPQTDTLATVPDTIPGVGSPTKVALAAAFLDPYSGIPPLPPLNLEFAFSMLADRTTPFTAPGGIQLESFFDLMPLDASNIGGVANRTFTYPSALDTNNPQSPAPDYTLSQISRSWQEAPPPPVDPFPGTYCPPTSGIFDCDELAGAPPACPIASNLARSEIYWEVYTPGSTIDTTFDLPTLPPTAPRAADEGLFDRAVTPEFDVFRWTALTFKAGADPAFDFNTFSFGAMDNDTTHVSLNYVEY